MKALLVDDETLVREGLSLKLQLEDPTIEVRSCGTLEQAREEIKSFEPDLVFLDVKLGGDHEAGLKFLEEIKETGFPGRVVMLSGGNDRATVGRAIATGAVGFISKSDQSTRVLTHAINLLLQGGVYISNEVRQPQLLESRIDAPQSRTSSINVSGPIYLIKEVGPEILGITAPRVYETLWHIANGDVHYKTVAKKMGISHNTAQEFARVGFHALNVTSKDQFLILLTRKGWKLKAPASQAERMAR